MELEEMFQQAEKVSEEAEDVQRQQFLALKSKKKNNINM